MRVKSRKPPGRELQHFRTRDLTEFFGRPDDRIGDQVRQVAGDAEHQIMMFGRHTLDIGAESPPEGSEALDSGRIGVGRRRQDAPAADEQLGKSSIGPGVLGARDRMGGHEVHTLWKVGRHVPQHRALHRTDVGDDRAGLEMRADLGRDRPAGADRYRHDHEVGALNRRRVGLGDLIGDAKFGNPPSRSR